MHRTILVAQKEKAASANVQALTAQSGAKVSLRRVMAWLQLDSPPAEHVMGTIPAHPKPNGRAHQGLFGLWLSACNYLVRLRLIGRY